ncbi:MAG: GNAT family N-acetyltransferase [Elusimicrobia bacterium]|nr:GNAT family N-acetyltransferase [Elusimicrobiota bacterium]
MIQVKFEDKNLINLIAAMAKEIWHEHYAPICPDGQVDYMLNKFQSYGAIEKQIKQKELSYYIIECDGKYAGYFAFAPHGEEMFLSKFYIYKHFRGKGLARKVINFVAGIAKGRNLNAITLTVNRHNTGSIAVYQKIGFLKDKEALTDIGGGFVTDDFCFKLSI